MDASGLDQLPWYARHLYRALLDIYSEMEERFAVAGKSNLVNYAISSMKTLVRAYLGEAKWYQSRGRVPNFEEYMEVVLVNSSLPALVTHSLVCMGELVTEDAVDWVHKNPLILRASSVIVRLMNDIVGHEDEKERGEVISAVECYAKQYGASTEETIAELEKQVRNAWKDTNKECLVVGSTPVVPTFVLERILNFSRVSHLMYKDFDAYTHSSKKKIKDLITSVLVDPVPM